MGNSKISLETENIAQRLTKSLSGDEAVKKLFEAEMGIDQSVVRKLLSEAMHSGGDFADLHFEYSTRNSVVMEDGIIKNSAVAVVSGVGIRVVHDDQTGYAYSEDFDLKPMMHAARTAASIASSGDVSLDDAFRFNELVPKDYYPVLKTVTEMDLVQKIEMVQQTEAIARDYDERINRVTVAMMDAINLTQVVTSEGQIMRDTRPMFRMNVHCLSQDGKNIQNGTSGIGGRVGLDYLKKANYPLILGEQAASEAILLLGAKQAPSGLMPVILGPAQSGILLHEAVGHPLEADFNRKGTSAYSGRVGEKVASDLCTIYDAGTIPHERGSINFDDEGVPSSQNLLIENGVLRNYMHDRISAMHFRTNPTGNGRRESYAHYPLPRMTSTYLAKGDSDPEEIIGSIKKGVYCQEFSGGQVDISNGDFVFVPTVAWLVEDGKKTVPIKNFTLIGNGPDAMSKISMVGNDFAMSEGIWTCGKEGQNVPVGVGLPTVLVSEMTVGGM